MLNSIGSSRESSLAPSLFQYVYCLHYIVVNLDVARFN